MQFLCLIWTEKHGSEREASQTFAAVFTKCLRGTLKNSQPTAILEKSRGTSPVLTACPISDALITQIPADKPATVVEMLYLVSYADKTIIETQSQVLAVICPAVDQIRKE